MSDDREWYTRILREALSLVAPSPQAAEQMFREEQRNIDMEMARCIHTRKEWKPPVERRRRRTM